MQVWQVASIDTTDTNQQYAKKQGLQEGAIYGAWTSKLID